ncbi:hypothetical protein LY76DRAFT_360487 [Colletotrichum caudatum]|nr:hypothetical protein LY76DRAFT_360487 [Colletotrichum caudatum]
MRVHVGPVNIHPLALFRFICGAVPCLDLIDRIKPTAPRTRAHTHPYVSVLVPPSAAGPLGGQCVSTSSASSLYHPTRPAVGSAGVQRVLALTAPCLLLGRESGHAGRPPTEGRRSQSVFSKGRGVRFPRIWGPDRHPNPCALSASFSNGHSLSPPYPFRLDGCIVLREVYCVGMRNGRNSMDCILLVGLGLRMKQRVPYLSDEIGQTKLKAGPPGKWNRNAGSFFLTPPPCVRCKVSNRQGEPLEPHGSGFAGCPRVFGRWRNLTRRALWVTGGGEWPVLQVTLLQIVDLPHPLPPLPLLFFFICRHRLSSS